MDHFTPVDAMNSSNFLREVALSDGSSTLHFLMPVTGFEYNGQPVTPPGFDQEYGLYLTIDAAHPPVRALPVVQPVIRAAITSSRSCDQPPPIEKSPAGSALHGAPICSSMSARSSEPQHDAGT